jgi:hypothetical protein
MLVSSRIRTIPRSWTRATGRSLRMGWVALQVWQGPVKNSCETHQRCATLRCDDGFRCAQPIYAGFRSTRSGSSAIQIENASGGGGDFRGGLFDVVNPVVVRIVDASQIDALIATHQHIGFVKQQPNSHFLQARNHSNRVVVAQDGENRTVEMSPNPGHAFERRVEGT